MKLYDRSISTVRENGKTIGLIGLTIPLLLESVFVLLYGTVSTLILSGYADAAVSAAGVAQQVINIAVAVLNMVAKGTVIISSIALGAKNLPKVRAAAGTGLLLAVGLSALIGIGLCGFAAPLMRLMHLQGEVHGLASDYLRIAALAFPLTATMSYINNLLICHGYSRISMFSGILSNVLNLLLSYLALYGGAALPVSGVQAVALCGAAAQLAGLLLSAFFFVCKRCPFRFCFRGRLAWDILRLGAPAGMSIVSYNFSQMVTTGFITGLGIAVINTKLYVTNIVSYTSRISLSLGNAGGILMGRHRGAGRLDLVKRLYRQNLLIALLCNGIISLLALALHTPLLSIFTHDREILSAAGVIMAIDFLVELPRAVNHVSENSFNANGDVKTPLVTSIASGWGCNVLFSWLLAVVLGWGLPGVWIASVLDESFKATVYLLRWKSGKWQNARI